MEWQRLLIWLRTGIMGFPHAAPPPLLYWHARFMVLGWTIAIPAAAFIARFCKILPGQNWPQTVDSKYWWIGHRRLVDFGAAAICLGLILAWFGAGPGSDLMMLHEKLGWIITGGVVVQVLAGLLRGGKGGPTEALLRGDHYDMTPRRLLFEYLHKSLGWVLIMAAGIEVFLGLWMINAPRWMPIVIALWWVFFILGFVLLQARGFCVDTYQAIWGPDPSHPGNLRFRPIGWGVRRP